MLNFNYSMKSLKTELTQASCWTELTEWTGHSNSISLLHPSCTRIFTWCQGAVVQTTRVGWEELFHIVLFLRQALTYLGLGLNLVHSLNFWSSWIPGLLTSGAMDGTPALCARQALCCLMDLDSQPNYSCYCHWIWDTGSSSYLPSVVLFLTYL